MCGQNCKRKLAHCLLRWRSWIRPFVLVCYASAVFIAIPFLVVNLTQSGIDAKVQIRLVAMIFTLMTLPLTFWEIIQHLIHYTRPELQKHIIRILWMVPIYSLNAWLGISYPKYAIYMDTLRECYEAYVIYNFMIFLLNFLNAEMSLCEVLELKPQVGHIFPLCCVPSWEMGSQLIHRCKHGILQYTVVRPLTTVISLGCEMGGVYKEGEFKGDVAFPYMFAVNNLSQFVAMYCLVLFYRACRVELEPMKPLLKFACIKAVVFFSFMQQALIQILVWTGVITSVFGAQEDVHQIGSVLQDFCICVEMFLAGIAHHFAFSYKPYVNLAAVQPPCCDNFLSMWDVSDVRQDVSEHIGVLSKTVTQGVRRGGGGPSGGRLTSGPSNSRAERTKLLDPCASTGTESSVSSFATIATSGQSGRYQSMEGVADVDVDTREEDRLIVRRRGSSASNSEHEVGPV